MPKPLIAWTELTTPAGAEASRFYSQVLNVSTAPFRMEDHDDYNVPAEEPSFGICDPRSSDGTIPPGWIVYLRVPSLEDALTRAKELGAEVLTPPQHTKGYGAHAVIRDPVGNTTALYEEDNDS